MSGAGVVEGGVASGGGGSYTSNASIGEVASRLCGAGAGGVVVLTHAKPDGDAIGSVLGLTRALRLGGVSARGVLCPPIDGRFSGMLSGDGALEVAEEEGFFERAEISGAGVVAVLDTGAFGQLGPAEGFVRGRRDTVVIVDHHRGGEDGVAAVRHVDAGAAAACQLVARVAAEVLGCGVSSLPEAIASPLYLGLASDTGWFRHPSVTPEVFRCAADLLEAGADHNALFLRSEQSDPPVRLELMRRALTGLELVGGGRAALMTLSAGDFSESGAAVTDAGGLVDLPKTIGSIEVSALLTEAEPGLVKVSMRSKSGGLDIDVNGIAGSFGGGGHRHAAGAKLRCGLDEAVGLLRESVARAIEAAEGVGGATGGSS